ncbi:hypothetical protein ABES03_08410 [Neobacillus rhizosphaerae]|uniref:hypothetical protein n=1 Tax=Neobacillus rhizosphaerae TaxID=2880965 RepID=UPI003D29E112
MKTLYENLFTAGNYKATFSQEVEKLIKQDLTDEFKMKLIQALTDAYIDQTGKVPDSYELSRLTTWLVVDKTKDPDKVTKTEYPILSEHQQKLRARRELPHQAVESFSPSSRHKINGRKAPKNFRVFGEYEGGY